VDAKAAHRTRLQKEHVMLAEQSLFGLEPSSDPAPAIGGTLCLLSCALTSLLNAASTADAVVANPFYIKRIADNLALLADNVTLDAHFRRVCRRLFEHWESRLNALASDAPVRGAPTSEGGAEVYTCKCAEALASTIRFH
jgi:hypothetical protein